ncbi:hypothetical protein BX616_007153, partial [Lobosporangium transversale]
EAIFNFTNGYADLCRYTLNSLRSSFRDGSTAPEMLRFLISPDFRGGLSMTRVFSRMSEWSPSEEESELLCKALLTSDRGSFCDAEMNTNPPLSRFYKSDLLTIVDKRPQFTAPINRVFLGHRFFSSRIGEIVSPGISFDGFLTRAIERMRPSVLRTSLGVGVDTVERVTGLLERTWQMEWYRAASSVVPLGSTISLDVGPVFGSVGFLNFYVNGYRAWGIELLREGNQMAEHARRFETGGEYKNIPLKKWVIIDFRHHSTAVREIRNNFWHALYSDDYSTITIRRLDHQDQVIT